MGRDGALGARLRDDDAGAFGEREDRVVELGHVRDAGGLGRVRQEDVDVAEQVAQAAVPPFGRVPVGVDRGGGAVGPDAFEQRGELRREALLQEVRAHVHVPGAFEACGVDQLGPQVRDRPRVGEDRAVVRAGEDDGDAGRPGLVDDEPADVHPAALELVAQETTEVVVAHDAAEADAEPEPGRAGRDDRPGTADGQPRPVDEPLGLSERGLDGPRQHEVGVRVAEHEEIERVGHARTIPEVASTVAPEVPGYDAE